MLFLRLWTFELHPRKENGQRQTGWKNTAGMKNGSLGDLRLLSQRRSTSYRGRTEHVARGSLWKRFDLTAQRASQIGGLFLEQHRGRYGHWRHGGGILLG